MELSYLTQLLQQSHSSNQGSLVSFICTCSKSNYDFPHALPAISFIANLRLKILEHANEKRTQISEAAGPNGVLQQIKNAKYQIQSKSELSILNSQHLDSSNLNWIKYKQMDVESLMGKLERL